MTYQQWLEYLPSHVGDRNRHLMSVAAAGKREGMDDERIVADIMSFGGTPPIKPYEARRAVLRCKVTERTQESSQTPASDYSFVREMIDLGGGEASSADLMALTRWEIPKEFSHQALMLCDMLRVDNGSDELYFTGDKFSKRTREALKTLEELEDLFAMPDYPVPPLILPNPLTGEGVLNDKGEQSYALKQCVKSFRNTVIEFDELPLKKQAAFWVGVIKSNLLDIKALVYSGGKSIHGLIRLDESKDFKTQWVSLRRALCSDVEAQYRCDVAFENPVQMMRLPGAIRPDNGKRQQLLYLGE